MDRECSGNSTGDARDVWLLATTSRSILLLHPPTGRGYRLDSGRGAYYGIARYGDRIVVAARRRLAISPFHERESRGELLFFDENLKYTGAAAPAFPLREMHQVLSVGGRLWVTCTFDNMIAIYDGKEEWERWYPKGAAEAETKDVHHFNSLAVIDGDLCLLAHNHGKSEILTFQLPTLVPQRSISLGVLAHNIWKEGDRWMTCSSGEGRIVGTDGFATHTGGFPRGVAITERAAYVGISTHCERALRDFSNSWIQVYSPDWKRVGTIDLAREGIVLDLMPFSRPDGPIFRGMEEVHVGVDYSVPF